jgi:hypothetical protein
MKYVLNSPILTNYGLYRYKEITTLQAREILKNGTFVSAIGHEATAKLLSSLLETEIQYNRIAIVMQVGDIAIVIRLLTRLSEGLVLTKDEIKKIGYSLALLERLE